jgi:glyoxylase-like metal-dependent hydrolase (beta-lactamase superfamily II)
MWWLVALAVLAILLTPAGIIIGSFAARKPLPERAELNGMTLVKNGFVSAGLIPLGADEVALVDAGIDRRGKALLADLARQGFGPDDVKVILLTHGHSDHIGAIREFPKAQVMALAAEVDVVEGRSSGGGAILRFKRPKPTGIRLHRTLQDGELIPLGPFTARVFALPGHTPGSAAYLIGPNLFLGDSANQDRQGRLIASAWIFCSSTEQNRKSLLELARRLAGDHTIKALVFSHSAPLEQGTAPLAEFARRAAAGTRRPQL